MDNLKKLTSLSVVILFISIVSISCESKYIWNNPFDKNEMPLKGLIAYYPFNGNANDESGNGFNGIVNGAVLDKNRFGDLNEAYKFDGIDDYIKISPIILGTQRTISTWVNTTVNSTTQTIIFRGNVYWGAYFYYFYITRNGEYEYGHRIRSNRVTSDIIVADSSWHHIAATWDGSTGSLFFDGELEKSELYPASPTGSTNHDNVYIGAAYANDDTLQSFFKGYIDELRIYDRVLTAQEIKAIYLKSN